MFLLGGPAFSGTTLLALLLNQDHIVCLDEPDFHDPSQNHRGIPLLKSLFPDRVLPDSPQHPLSHRGAFDFISQCERLVPAEHLGMKTCDRVFISYSEIYREHGCPVVAIFRDIRDALIRRLPEWVTVASLNRSYREVWTHRDEFDAWVRYEDLVTNPSVTIKKISTALRTPLDVRLNWRADHVHSPMLKLDRHELLRSGAISSQRLKIWKTSGRRFSDETIETAHAMGYGD